MRRLRAFVLTELLTAMLMQGLFIVVLCTSFYLLTSFYSNTQQVLTAREHAERVIAFFDDKIRHTGLGLWKCNNTDDVRNMFNPFTDNKSTPPKNTLLRLIDIPLAITSNVFGKDTSNTDTSNSDRIKLRQSYKINEDTENESTIYYGSCVTLIYAQRDISHTVKSTPAYTKDDDECVLIIGDKVTLEALSTSEIKLLDSKNEGVINFTKSELHVKNGKKNETGTNYLYNWAVTQSSGVPFCLPDHNNSTTQNVKVWESETIPAASELMYLRCMQMFVRDGGDEGRQFAFREMENSTKWKNDYLNQEKGILEIYMELDTKTKIFTLYVLATGGYDYTINTERPKESDWPNRARPLLNNNNNQTRAQAEKAWKDIGYDHHIIYVSRASWKLNNIPENFTWN